MKSFKHLFPIFERPMNGRPLIYLDSAATSLKPKSVIERINTFNSYETANVHRGAYTLSDKATAFYEGAREKVAQFIGAKSNKEIVFTRGTTESINLVANSISSIFNEGDSILLTEMEHHANIVPWQLLAERKNLKIKVLPILMDGTLDLSKLDELLTPDVKLFAFTHCSNHLGTINDVELLTKKAHQKNILCLVDGAQIIGKHPVHVGKLDADFYVFSGHKMYAPFGIGVLFAKEALLDKMPPYQGGGSMIDRVTFAKTTYNEIPFRFEAGTPNVEGAVGLASAIEFIESLGWQTIESHQTELMNYAHSQLKQIAGLKWIGTDTHRAALYSFVLENCHSTDVGYILNEKSVAVRVGHHCTQPLTDKYGIPGSIRASFGIYNDLSDIDVLIEGLKKAQEMLS